VRQDVAEAILPIEPSAQPVPIAPTNGVPVVVAAA
jgi:hypothetical protein